MAKSDFRPFVPEMGTAPHFGKSTQQFFDAVIPDRGPKERAGVEKYLSTPFKGITTDGNVIPGSLRAAVGIRPDTGNPASGFGAAGAVEPGAKSDRLPAARIAGAGAVAEQHRPL